MMLSPTSHLQRGHASRPSTGTSGSSGASAAGARLARPAPEGLPPWWMRDDASGSSHDAARTGSRQSGHDDAGVSVASPKSELYMDRSDSASSLVAVASKRGRSSRRTRNGAGQAAGLLSLLGETVDGSPSGATWVNSGDSDASASSCGSTSADSGDDSNNKDVLMGAAPKRVGRTGSLRQMLQAQREQSRTAKARGDQPTHTRHRRPRTTVPQASEAQVLPLALRRTHTYTSTTLRQAKRRAADMELPFQTLATLGSGTGMSGPRGDVTEKQLAAEMAARRRCVRHPTRGKRAGWRRKRKPRARRTSAARYAKRHGTTARPRGAGTDSEADSGAECDVESASNSSSSCAEVELCITSDSEGDCGFDAVLPVLPGAGRGAPAGSAAPSRAPPRRHASSPRRKVDASRDAAPTGAMKGNEALADARARQQRYANRAQRQLAAVAAPSMTPAVEADADTVAPAALSPRRPPQLAAVALPPQSPGSSSRAGTPIPAHPRSSVQGLSGPPQRQATSPRARRGLIVSPVAASGEHAPAPPPPREPGAGPRSRGRSPKATPPQATPTAEKDAAAITEGVPAPSVLSMQSVKLNVALWGSANAVDGGTDDGAPAGHQTPVRGLAVIEDASEGEEEDCGTPRRRRFDY